MSCAKIGESPLNPYNKPLTCKTGTGATITAALSAIAVTAGVLALLATQGVHLGPLNALSAVSVPGASVLAGLGGLVLIATAVWFIQKAKERCGAPKKVDTGVTEDDVDRLQDLFFDAPEVGVTKTVTFLDSVDGEWPLHYTDQATLEDAQKMMVDLLDLNTHYTSVKFVCEEKVLDKDSWANIPDEGTVYLVLPGEKVDTGVTEDDVARLETLFIEENDDRLLKTTGTFMDIVGETWSLTYTDEVTLEDAQKKIVVLLGLNCHYTSLKFVSSGTALDKDSWGSVESGSIISFVIME